MGMDVICGHTIGVVPLNHQEFDKYTQRNKMMCQNLIRYLIIISFASLSFVERQNRKILEQLEEQKKRLRMQAQTAPAQGVAPSLSVTPPPAG